LTKNKIFSSFTILWT